MNNPTPEQINRELAEKVMGWEWLELEAKEDGDYLDSISYTGLWDPINKKRIIGWSPANDLNQIFHRLLPVLLAKSENLQVATYFWEGDYKFEITNHNTDNWFRVSLRAESLDKIPETICKAILEAWEKINE